MNTRCQVMNKAGKRTAVIDIYGVIGFDPDAPDQGESPQRNMRPIIREKLIDAMKGGAEQIFVNITAETGDAETAMELYELFAGQSVPVTTYMHGYCGTAAVVVAQAGDQRQASESALFSITGDHTFFFGSYNQNTLRERVKEIKQNNKIVSNLFANHSRHNAVYYLGKMNANAEGRDWMDAGEFINTGLIDKVVKPKDGEQTALGKMNLKTSKISNRRNTAADRTQHARQLKLIKLKGGSSANK